VEKPILINGQFSKGFDISPLVPTYITFNSQNGGNHLRDVVVWAKKLEELLDTPWLGSSLAPSLSPLLSPMS
jgi:hypothetical protein